MSCKPMKNVAPLHILRKIYIRYKFTSDCNAFNVRFKLLAEFKIFNEVICKNFVKCVIKKVVVAFLRGLVFVHNCICMYFTLM